MPVRLNDLSTCSSPMNTGACTSIGQTTEQRVHPVFFLQLPQFCPLASAIAGMHLLQRLHLRLQRLQGKLTTDLADERFVEQKHGR